MTEEAGTSGHKRFPEKLAFMLNNPVRRLLNPPERLVSKFNVQPDQVVLDFGCGPGYYTIPLSKIARRTIAVDISSTMLNRLADYARKNHAVVERIQSDGTQISLPDASVDTIVLVHVFHEIEEQAAVLGEFRRLLRSSGRLLIVEKTRGDNFLARKFGPPIVNESQMVHQITDAGFAHSDTVEFGNDFIIISSKP